MNATQAAIFRRRKVGLVYQFYNLIPTLTVKKNILMPLLLDKRKVNQEYFEQVVTSLGLHDKLDALPNQMSGGQQQENGYRERLFTVRPFFWQTSPPATWTGRTRRKSWIC